jgi:hypothetical protein
MRFSEIPPRLLVINYSMNENDPLLSHQIEAVRSLSRSFSHVMVITSFLGPGLWPSNVTVKDLKWSQRSVAGNALNFLRVTLPLIIRRDVVIFSHMTDVQAALIAPVARILGVKHYQWYAHTTLSRYLRWSRMWVNGIITSTSGSCPITGKKVFPIGQAIIPESFGFIARQGNKLTKALHVGRFDPSKDIYLLAETCRKISENGIPISFTQIGDPTTDLAKRYAKSFELEYADLIEDQVILVRPSILRSEIVSYMAVNDFFIHAYVGSLDKTLIEATLSGLPVITLNPEYQSQFGTWSGLTNPSLYSEYIALKNFGISELNIELERRRLICESEHSLENWTRKLTTILSKGELGR